MSRYLFILCALLMSAYGCSTVRVSQDYRPEANFAALAAYQWHPMADQPAGIGQQDPLMNERIRKAVEENLYNRGFRKSISEIKPDFLISFQYDTRQTIESRNVGTQVGIGGAWGWSPGLFGGIGVGTGREVYTLEEGVIYINFLDPHSGSVIWRGKGTHNVEEHWAPERKSREINELVGEVLGQFPPG